MERILLLEDDDDLNYGLTTALKKYNYQVDSCFDGIGAKKLLSKQFDLMLLDVNLPDTNGFDLCKFIKNKFDIPIIFLTVKNQEKDMLDGFKVGCDDYITKPFSIPVLKEKIHVILKRAKIGNNNIYISENLLFDFDKMVLTKNNNLIKLTAKEIKIVNLLISNRNKVLTKGQILEKVWELDSDFVDESALIVNISRIRNKIEDIPSKPRYLKTVFGIGYIWDG